MTGSRHPALTAADVARIAAEAGPALAGGRVRSVRPRGREGFFLGVRLERETRWLLVALGGAGLARAHLVEDAEAIEPETPLVQQLRARLEGAEVVGVEAVAGERALRVRFVTSDGVRLALRISLFGRPEAVLEDDASSLRNPGTQEASLEVTAAFEDTASLAAHFDALEIERAVEERRRAFEVDLGRRRKKALAACQKLQEVLAETGRAEEAQRDGDLLLASLHLVKRGSSEVVVPDYYAGPDAPPRRIALDPEVPPTEQAQRYFKRAKKYRRGAEVAKGRLAGFEQEVARLDAAAARLAEDGDVEAAAALAGIRLDARKPFRRKGPEVSTGPRKFRSRDGLEILVGRSNAENDELTMRTARSNDVFLHVAGFPGSHVIVRAPARGKTVPLETLLDAATLAHHYSKARDHLKAEVTWTPRKYVRKPRGAKPGMVLVERGQTLLVGRDEERLKRVLDSAGTIAEPPDAAPRLNG